MLNFSANRFFRTLSGIFSIGSILFCQSSSFAQSLVPSVIPIDEEFVAMQYFYLDASLGALGPFFNGEVVQPIGETQIDYMSTYYLTVDPFGNVEGSITGRATGLYFGYFIDILYDGVTSTLPSPAISTFDNGFKPITWSFTSKGKYDFKPIEAELENPQNNIVPLDENRFGSFTDRGEITQTDEDSANISMSIAAWVSFSTHSLLLSRQGRVSVASPSFGAEFFLFFPHSEFRIPNPEFSLITDNC